MAIPTCDQALAEFMTILSDVFILIIAYFKITFECFLSLFISRTEKSVQGKLIVITGAGHGLGREMAILFAGRGANVALVDINEADVKDVAEGLKDSEGKILPFICDVRSDEKVSQTFNLIRKQMDQPVDILINNAGIVSCKPFSELTPQGIERTFQVNVFAHFWSIRSVLTQMIARGEGHIVAVASIAGLMGTSNLTDYCASKFATVGMMKALEQELHDKGQNENITLSTICPVAMRTGMFQSPKTRFESIFPVIDPIDAAKQIVHSVLTDERLVIVPKSVEYFYRIGHLFPTKFSDQLQAFFQYCVDAHSDVVTTTDNSTS